MNKSKLIYGAGLIALSLAVFFIASRVHDKFHFRFTNETHWGHSENKSIDSMSIAGVKQLNANGTCDIVLIPSDEERVVFYYNKEEVENLSAVKDGVLNIGFNHEGGHLFSFKRTGSILVKIYSKSIDDIEQDGVGSFTTEGVLVQENIKLSNEGVGSMELEVQAKRIDIANGGVGSIDIIGTADDASLRNEGTGSIEAKKLMLKNAKVSNQGIGSISVQASETLDMTNQGVGSIDYRGAAKIINLKSEGIGSISKS
jgi:hypothetical protein